MTQREQRRMLRMEDIIRAYVAAGDDIQALIKVGVRAGKLLDHLEIDRGNAEYKASCVDIEER